MKRANPFRGAMAKFYDAWFTTPVGRYVERVENELLLRMAGPLEKAVVLDVGCGTANHLLLFSMHGMSWGVGVDPSMDMLRVAKTKIEDQQIFLIQAEAHHLPFKENSFTLVTSITALEFIARPEQAIREMGRVGRGRMVLAVLNRLSLSSMIRKLQALFKQSVFRYARFLSPFQLKELVRRALPVLDFHWQTILVFFPLFCSVAEAVFYKLDTWVSHHKFPFGTFLVMQVEYSDLREKL